MPIERYQPHEKLSESVNARIYRAERTSDGRAVILKLLNGEYPSPAQLARLRREYDILHKLRFRGVIEALAYENYQDSRAIVLDDHDALDLRRVMTGRRLALAEVLRLGVAITDALDRVHEARIIHKDINPANILCDSALEHIWLIDFGIASELSRETADAVNPAGLEGTLLYMSPEQTGRMNRTVDYRTDLYSLGVTLFEMVTGQLPFVSDDPMELVHCHIARLPPTATAIDPTVPGTVSDIITKLLNKRAEDRYQSAASLRGDLQRCYKSVSETGTVAAFPIAASDVPDRFHLPQKLYGREAETATLLATFDRVASGGDTTLMLVAGYSGIGKSALVHELHKPIVARRGFFIAGKFDQFNRNIPYASLIQAFQVLVRQLLTESEASLAAWREKLLVALGPNGQVIVDVIPQVELIIGPQPAVPTLSPTESRNRFNLVFERFVCTFAAAAHPLALFVDDLQWADPPSLRLLERLVGEARTRHMLVIGAYRDNEVDARHPLVHTLDGLRRAGARIETLVLAPLDLEDVQALLADTLYRPLAETASLAHTCHARTAGSPFFLSRFLIAVHEEGHIRFSRESQRWTWEEAPIAAMATTDNVVDLMARKLETLPAATRRVLELAASIGNEFDLATLAIVNERSPMATAAELWEGLKEGLVVPVGDAYRFLSADGGVTAADVEVTAADVRYRFLHDRVQQAAYSLIAEPARPALHRRIGRLMIAGASAAERDAHLFTIVTHFNLGKALAHDQDERDAGAALNLEAGLKAKRSAAAAAARDLFDAGIELVGSEGFARCYELTLALHVEAVEACHLTSDFERMNILAAAVLEHARSQLEKAKVHEVAIQAFVAQNRLPDALDRALEVLALLGEEFPDQPDKVQIGKALQDTQSVLDGRIHELADLPPMRDPEKLAAIRILGKSVSVSYLANPMLLPLIVLRMVVLSARHGHASESCFGYAAYALLLCGPLGDIPAGYEFGKLAQTVLDRMHATDQEARTRYVLSASVRHWREPSRETFASFPAIYQIGLETGELEYAGYALLKRSWHGYFSGVPLTEIEQETRRYSQAMQQLHQDTQRNYLDAAWQMMLNLMGDAEDPCHLSGEAFDEDVMLARAIAGKDAFGVFNIRFCKMSMLLRFDRDAEALALLNEMRPGVAVISSLVHEPVFFLWDSLALLRAAEKAPTAGRRRYLRIVAGHIKKLRTWAEHGPANNLHRLRIVEAERARVTGKVEAAFASFRQAIDAAREGDHQHDEALAHELVGRLWKERGDRELARLFLNQACRGYRLWGAEAKARQIEHAYPEMMLAGGAASGALSTVATVTTTQHGSAGKLDLASVLKASQTISREVVLGDLLQRLVQVLIENAGATRGVLMLERRDGLRVVADGTADGVDVLLLETETVQEGTRRVPAAVVNLVRRTGEGLVLDHAANDERFLADSYVRATQPRSVLCQPITNQGQVAGVIYLENNLTTGAFTPDRIEVIKLLSGQIAISIANAELVETLEERVSARTAQLELRNRFIRQTFGRYLSEEIVNNLLESPEGLDLGGEARTVTIMMTDVRGFTTMAQGMPPAAVVQLLNNYLSAMTEVILRYEGTIDEFIGDAILVIFGAPLKRPDDAARAVACALAMQLEMAAVNDWNRAHELPELEMGIGINTGEVVVGNIGSYKRAKYGVVGSNVNMAARIESNTVGGQVLIAQATRDAIDAELDIEQELSIEPKGVREPVTLSAVRGIGKPYDVHLGASQSRAPVPVHSAIAVSLAMVDDKAISATEYRGEIVALSASEAIIASTVAIVLHRNLRLRICDAKVPGGTLPDDVYGKVIACDPGSDRFRVRFTSLRGTARAYLHEVMSAETTPLEAPPKSRPAVA